MILKTKAFPIGKNSIVHQAELAAILQAAVDLLPYATRGQITIHSDSQAALRALDSPVISSKLVLDTVYAFDLLAMTNNFPS